MLKRPALWAFAASTVVVGLGAAGVVADDAGDDARVAASTSQAASIGDTTGRSDSAARQPPSLSAAPPHLVVDMAGCEAGVAYEFSDAPVEASSKARPVAWFRPAGSQFRGPVAGLTFADESETTADLEGLDRKVTVFPDGAAVLEWRDATGHVALLSAKRMSAEALDGLGVAVMSGQEREQGFERLDVPAEGASVEGFSCSVDGAFVGVEVVTGSTAAQVAYIATTDPTGVDSHQTFTVITFNRRDGGPVPVAGVDDATWRELVEAAPADDTVR